MLKDYRGSAEPMFLASGLVDEREWSVVGQSGTRTTSAPLHGLLKLTLLVHLHDNVCSSTSRGGVLDFGVNFDTKAAGGNSISSGICIQMCK